MLITVIIVTLSKDEDTSTYCMSLSIICFCFSVMKLVGIKGFKLSRKTLLRKMSFFSPLTIEMQNNPLLIPPVQPLFCFNKTSLIRTFFFLISC